MRILNKRIKFRFQFQFQFQFLLFSSLRSPERAFDRFPFSFVRSVCVCPSVCSSVRLSLFGHRNILRVPYESAGDRTSNLETVSLLEATKVALDSVQFHCARVYVVTILIGHKRKEEEETRNKINLNPEATDTPNRSTSSFLVLNFHLVSFSFI